nr:WYL domain-containing protein [Lachnospiraceae bacterium]
KSDRESVLNPYAFISQNGQYYIVATHSGFANPAHYRIDRIYSVKLINTGVGNKKSYAKREEIPLRLRRFFKGNKFNADAYTSAYPLMAYHEKRGIQKCAFVCLESALTVAIDYFGTADPVKISEYDKDDNYVRVEVFADYNNVKMFCTQYYSIVTPISPEELKDDVRTQVEGLLERLDKFV